MEKELIGQRIGSGTMFTGRAAAEREASPQYSQQFRASELQYRAAALQCTALWVSLQTAEDAHPYLRQKRIRAYGLKMDRDGELVAPLRDIAGKLWNIERITLEGYDSMEKEGRWEGCFHTVGEASFQYSAEILITAGYAAAASVYQATGRPTIVAFGSDNLKAVALEIKRVYRKPIIILGDHDAYLPDWMDLVRRSAKKTASEVAAEVGAVCVFPGFTPEEMQHNYTDFNDLHQVRGLEAVKEQLESLLAQSKKG
jgi:putative DNA primase/helicase